MQLFFDSNITNDSNTHSFSREESKHIAKVLRKKEGDLLHITNGKGWLFEVKITLATPNKCISEVKTATYNEANKLNIHLAVAPTKMNDRYEWFLEKATEIGITQITPIICDHSERKMIKKERFEKIIQSAAKQSLQFHFPILNDAVTLKAFLEQKFEGDLFIAHCEDQNNNDHNDNDHDEQDQNDQEKISLKKRLEESSTNSCTVLIGPEGDFSTQEIEGALSKNFLPISLGETRLRTETAAIVAVHSINFSKNT